MAVELPWQSQLLHWRYQTHYSRYSERYLQESTVSLVERNLLEFFCGISFIKQLKLN